MERELKFKLQDKSDYQKIREYLDKKYPYEILHQENYYYDTVDMSLLENNAVLRVRVEGENAIITFKRQKEKRDGYFISDENEVKGFLCDIKEIIAGKKRIIEICGKIRTYVEELTKNKHLKIIGRFKTERCKYKVDDMYLELDRVDFGNNFIDYEIESECDNEERVRNFLENLFESLFVHYQLQDKTKYQRYLEFHKITCPNEIKK